MKKFICALTAAVMLCMSMAGCGMQKKEITLTLRMPPLGMGSVANPDLDDGVEFFERAGADFAEQYDKANVKFNVEMFEYVKENEAIVGNFDTDNATDILYEGYFNMGTYIHSGKTVPLDDIISEELRGDIDASLWDMSSSGGKTYMMPYLSLQNLFAYNKDLFRQCGLDKYIVDGDKITSWTLEEWNEILDTLAEKLPENCYPIMMYAKNDQGDTHIMALLRSHGCKFFDESNNFSLENDEGIAALRWLRDGYSRGWYPPQCERLEIIDNTNLFINGQLAIFMINNASLSYYEDLDLGLVNFPDITGNGIVTSFVTGFEVFDNGDDDKIEVAKDFVKYLMETDKWVDSSTNGIPARNSVSEKYKDQIFMLEEFAANSKNTVDFTRNNPNWRGVRDVFYPNIAELLTGKTSPEDAAAAIDGVCNAAIEEGRLDSKLHE